VTNYNESRIYTTEELQMICPILSIMFTFDLIGLTSVRNAGYIDWGERGYIIVVYDKLRSTKDNMGGCK
jgi:hypothetical protein